MTRWIWVSLLLLAAGSALAGALPGVTVLRPARMNETRNAWGHQGVCVYYDTLSTAQGDENALFMPLWRPSGSLVSRNYEGIYASIEVVEGAVWVRHIGPMHAVASDSSRVVRLDAATNFFQSWKAATWGLRAWAVSGTAIVMVTLF